MRKVLLATTALVAMTGAAAAEVSVNGYYEFGYTSSSDDRTDADADQDAMFSDSEVHISFSETTDSGLTFGAKFELEGALSFENAEGVANDDGKNVNDESSLSVSSDMGTFVMGNNDYASDSYLTWLPGGRGTAVQSDNQFGIKSSNSTPAAIASGLNSNPNHAQFADTIGIGYFSPSMGGVSVGISIEDDGASEDTSMGISWSGDALGSDMTVTFANFTNNEATETKITSAGFTFGVGDATIAASTATTDNGTQDVTSTGIGIGFDLSDSLAMTAAIVDSEDDTSKDSLETVSLSGTYTIAPGLSIALAYNTYAYVDSSATANNNDASELVASIQGNF
jgi:outer membrane protein OmpU